MTTLEASAATESPGQMLRRLEVTILWMWSTEPVCPVDERHELLARLALDHDLHADPAAPLVSTV